MGLTLAFPVVFLVAVVPGAKFDARTTNGPARPLIESPRTCRAAPLMLNPTSTGVPPFARTLLSGARVVVKAPCSAMKRRLFDNEAATDGVMLDGRGVDLGVALVTLEAVGFIL